MVNNLPHLCSEAQEKLYPLLSGEKLWNNVWNHGNKLLEHPIIGHNFLLDRLPDRCWDQPDRWDQESQSGEGKRGTCMLTEGGYINTQDWLDAHNWGGGRMGGTSIPWFQPWSVSYWLLLQMTSPAQDGIDCIQDIWTWKEVETRCLSICTLHARTDYHTIMWKKEVGADTSTTQW